MSVIGPQLEPDTLVLTRGRDFKWSFENLDATGQPVVFPAGTLLELRGRKPRCIITPYHPSLLGAGFFMPEPCGGAVVGRRR